jgi:hypothetical protein
MWRGTGILAECRMLGVISDSMPYTNIIYIASEREREIMFLVHTLLLAAFEIFNGYVVASMRARFFLLLACLLFFTIMEILIE